MITIGTRVATVNIVFSTSRNAALIESKMLQYATISTNRHIFTKSDLKTQVFTLTDVLACLSIRCVDQKQHKIPCFPTQSDNGTLQTCVDIANEYLQAYNESAGLKNHLFYSLHHCKFASYTMFLIAFTLSNSIFRT